MSDHTHRPDEPAPSPMGAVRGCWPIKPCDRCGQMSDAAGICATCRAVEREPQGETVRLFEPAPAPMPGADQRCSGTCPHVLARTARSAQRTTSA